MNNVIAFMIFCAVSLTASAQTYKIGVLSVKGTMMKLPNPGTLVISDSAFATEIMGHEEVKRVANRPASNIVYITDGTATDKVTISPMVARLKGFKYDHAILIDQDERFNGGQVIYWCQKLLD